MKNQLTCDTFGENLIEQIPEFTDAYLEHKKDNFGEVLPHLLMGDFTRLIINLYRKGEKNSELFNRCIQFIESCFSKNEEKLVNLASVSFLENLYQAEDDYQNVKNCLGPLALKNLDEMENWKPS